MSFSGHTAPTLSLVQKIANDKHLSQPGTEYTNWEGHAVTVVTFEISLGVLHEMTAGYHLFSERCDLYRYVPMLCLHFSSPIKCYRSRTLTTGQQSGTIVTATNERLDLPFLSRLTFA